MNTERFFAANSIALLAHTLTQPIDMCKTRAQILQEGKGFTGIGFGRGIHWQNIMRETYAAGGGLKKFYSKFDAFFMRTVTYTTFRVWGFLYFYDWWNKDPRRAPRYDFYAACGLLGGFAGGFLSNPF